MEVKMNRMLACVLGAAFLGGPLLSPSAAATGSAAGGDGVVLHWNEIAVQAVGATPPFPSTRAMAIVQLAVFEAVNAITRQYTPYLGPLGAPGGASPDAAAVAAAHDTLVWLFPGQQGFLDTAQAESLAAIADGPAKDGGVAVGRAAAAAVIANRTGDGAAPAQFHTPPGDDPYEWQPTPSCASAPANNRGLFLHWQSVKPFGVRSAAQFRAPRPPALTSHRYARDLAEVTAVGDEGSVERPPDRADVAKLYAAQPPHRGWNLVARQLASARHDGITTTARTLAVMNMALSDVHITVFESKYRYRTWRPETAIRRADEDGNRRTSANPDYRPFVVTPCFPAYPSAHGAGSGAARVVLQRAYGRKGHALTITDAGAPGITLHYSDLRDITDDVSDARVFGGIHFRFEQDAGNEMGEDVGRYDDRHLLRRVHEQDDDDCDDGEDHRD
jgi:hypothetical protein